MSQLLNRKYIFPIALTISALHFVFIPSFGQQNPLTSTANASSYGSNVNLTINAGGKLIMDVAKSFASITTAGSGTSTIDGGGALTVSGDIKIAGGNALNINTATTATNIKTEDLDNATATIGGTGILTISNSVALNGKNQATATFVIGPTVTVATKDVIADNGTGNTLFQLTVQGTLKISNLFEAGSSNTPTSRVINVVSCSAGSTVEYNGTGAQAVYATTYHNLVLSGSSAKTLTDVSTINGNFSVTGTATAAAATDMNIKGDVTLGPTAFATFDAKTFSHTVGGNWSNNGNFITGSSTVTFNSGGIQTISGTASQSFNNVIIDKAGNGLVTDGVNSLTVQNLTQIKGDLNAPPTLNINGNLVHTAGNFIAGADINIKGNWTNNGTGFNAGSGTVSFNGNSLQTIGGSEQTTFNNLTINNQTATNPSVTLAQTENISNILTLKNGLLVISATSPTPTSLVLNNPNAISDGSADGIDNFGNTRHIVTQVNSSNNAKGILTVRGIDQSVSGYTFPVGDGTNYLPAAVNPASPNNFSITVFSGITANGQPGTPLTVDQRKDLVNAVWQIAATNGIATTLNLGWPQVLEGSNWVGTTDNKIGISANSGLGWGSSSGIFDGNRYTATQTGITTFSSFTAAILSQVAVLPVHFSNVKVAEKSSGVQVEFTNLTESDLDYYEVERSLDGKAFIGVNKLYPSKNNYGSASYSWLDATAKEGQFIYRIKAVETTGKTIFSNIVSITLGAKNSGLSVYAKGGQVAMQISNLPAGKYQLELFSAAGQLMGVESFSHAGGAISQTTSLKSAKPGIYILNISGGVRMQQKFLVQ